MEYFCVSLKKFKKWYRKLSCNSRMKIQRMSYFFVNLPTQWICYFIVTRLTTPSTKYKNKHFSSDIIHIQYRHSIYKWEITCIKHNFSCKTPASFKCKASLIENTSLFGLTEWKNLLKDLMNWTFSSLQILTNLLLIATTFSPCIWKSVGLGRTEEIKMLISGFLRLTL